MAPAMRRAPKVIRSQQPSLHSPDRYAELPGVDSGRSGSIVGGDLKLPQLGDNSNASPLTAEGGSDSRVSPRYDASRPQLLRDGR